jgi:hypothetical protein
VTIKIAVATRNAMLDTLVDTVDAGPAAGTVKVYTGAQPATADTAASGTLLLTFTCKDPAFGAAGSGTVTLDTTPALSAVAAATGTAGWARVADSTGATVFDGAVGTSGTDFLISSTSVTSGATVTLSAGSLSLAG